MRLVTFDASTHGARVSLIGALSGDDVVDLAGARAAQLADEGIADAMSVAREELSVDMLGFLRLGPSALSVAREAVDYASEQVRSGDPQTYLHAQDAVYLLAPIPRPPSLRCFLSGAGHVARAFKGGPPKEWAELPVYYKGNCDEVYGPDDTVPWPAYSGQLDYELEVCAVIGVEGRNVSVDDAEELIVGYTIYNDWSARDIQVREMSVGLGPSYGKDFANSIGPAIVTKDEFDLSTAQLISRVNGEEWSSGTAGDLKFSFAEMIHWVSQEQTLRPGDLLSSGPIGGGTGVELERWLPEDAELELEVEGIGVLRNRLSARGAGPIRAAEASLRPTAS